MTLEDMNKYLNDIHQQSSTFRLASAILTCYEDIKKLETALVETQQKINEMIGTINAIEKAIKVKDNGFLSLAMIYAPRLTRS